MPHFDLSTEIADWASSFHGDMPDKIETEARRSLVDTVACMFSGVQTDVSLMAEKTLEIESGGGTVPIVGGGASSLGGAAFVNGVRAHAIDFDDYEFAGSTHPSAPILGALLAVGLRHDSSLKDILRAWTVGYEVIVRFGEALGFGHYLSGWHSTSTLGPIAAAAACAHALKLPGERIATAMRMASSSSAGLQRQFGTDMKAAHVGLAARAGVHVALYSMVGANASDGDLWEGPMGFLLNYGTQKSPGGKHVLERGVIGEGVVDHPVARKSWPSCSYTQRSIVSGISAYGTELRV